MNILYHEFAYKADLSTSVVEASQPHSLVELLKYLGSLQDELSVSILPANAEAQQREGSPVELSPFDANGLISTLDEAIAKSELE